MRDSKQEMRKQLKEELDETLFTSLEFHTGLKERVRRKINLEQPESALKLFYKQLISKQRFMGMTAVAGICILLLSAIFISNPEENEPRFDLQNETNLNTLQEENLIENPVGSNTWELTSMDEAKQLFGEELLLPTYIPNPFKLDRIHLSGEKKEAASKLIFTYTGDDKVYSIIIEKDIDQLKPMGFEIVDINGNESFLKNNENPEILDAELHMYIRGNHYLISGLIPSTEAIKIAQSLK